MNFTLLIRSSYAEHARGTLKVRYSYVEYASHTLKLSGSGSLALEERIMNVCLTCVLRMANVMMVVLTTV